MPPHVGYFSGCKGSFQIMDDAPNIYPISEWEFNNETENVDITNTGSFGSQLLIPNIYLGTITAKGFVDDILISEGTIESGKYMKLELYFDYESDPKIGFFGENALPALVQTINYKMSNSGTAEYTMTAGLTIDPTVDL